MPIKRFLNEKFDEEKLYLEINNSLEEHIDLTEWITETNEERISSTDPQEGLPVLRTLHDEPSPYGYLPEKS